MYNFKNEDSSIFFLENQDSSRYSARFQTRRKPAPVRLKYFENPSKILYFFKTYFRYILLSHFLPLLPTDCEWSSNLGCQPCSTARVQQLCNDLAPLLRVFHTNCSPLNHTIQRRGKHTNANLDQSTKFIIFFLLFLLLLTGCIKCNANASPMTAQREQQAGKEAQKVERGRMHRNSQRTNWFPAWVHLACHGSSRLAIAKTVLLLREPRKWVGPAF